MTISPGFEVTILVGSVAAGVLGSLMGLGGGVLIIPMLTALGVDIRHAIAASIVAVIATSCAAASTYVRDGLANIRIGIEHSGVSVHPVRGFRTPRRAEGVGGRVAADVRALVHLLGVS